MTKNFQMESTITFLLLCIMNVSTGAGFSSTSTSIFDTFLLKIVCNELSIPYPQHPLKPVVNLSLFQCGAVHNRPAEPVLRVVLH